MTNGSLDSSTMASSPPLSDAALSSTPSQTKSFTEIYWESALDDEYEYEYISEEEGEERPKPMTLVTVESNFLIRTVSATAAEEEDASTSSSSFTMVSPVVDESMCGQCGRETHAPVDCETLRLWHTTTDTTGVVVMPSTLLTWVLDRLVQQVATKWKVPPVAAATLLYDVNWDAGQLTTRSMRDRGTNSVEVERASGVVQRCRVHRSDTPSTAPPAPVKGQLMTCEICMEMDVPVDDMVSMPCRHAYCKECWADFFTKTVEITDATASRCLRMQCPHAQCNERVTEEEISKSAPELLPHYEEQQFSAFLTSIGNGGYARSCPGTECNYIAVISRDHHFGNMYGRAVPVSCGGCSVEFCFRCGEAPHDLECRIIDERSQDEGGHKNCPRCQVRIEKNGGCNHMTCRCGHEFCWLCMEDYRGSHFCGREQPGRGGRGHDYFAEMFRLDRYENGEGDGVIIRDLPAFDLEFVCETLEQISGSELQGNASLVLAKMKEMARLAHYHARYAAHDQGQRYAAHRSMDIALQIHAFHQMTDIISGTDVDLFKITNERLVVLRRILKFSYILAYYLAEDTDENRMQKDLFQHRQEMLERFTEQLSHVSENATSQLDRSQVVTLLSIVEKCLMNLLEFMHGIP